MRAPNGMSAEERLEYRGWNVTHTGCWEILGGKKSGGYGVIQYQGQSVAAHRLSYETWVGPIPEGLLIRHKCDNPPCINPDHLEPGTDADNSRDMVERGRNRSLAGESHPMSKLSQGDANLIRHTYPQGVLTLKMLGEAFGVSIPTITRILSGKGYPNQILTH